MTGFLIVAPLGLIAAAVVVAWLESDVTQDRQLESDVTQDRQPISPRARRALRQSAGVTRERGTIT